MTANIAINGFGRIGRCFLRAALKDNVSEAGEDSSNKRPH